jgi:hypothetical protein
MEITHDTWMNENFPHYPTHWFRSNARSAVKANFLLFEKFLFFVIFIYLQALDLFHESMNTQRSRELSIVDDMNSCATVIRINFMPVTMLIWFA